MSFAVTTAPPDSRDWAELLKGASAATAFHEAGWLSTATAQTAVLIEGREVLAGICVPTAPCTNGKPHMIPYAGPLVTDRALASGQARQRRIHRALCEWVQQCCPGLRFCTSPWVDLHPYWVTAGFRAILLYTYVVDIRDPSRTDERFAPALRANIRKARRDGFNVSSRGSLDRALELARANFARRGLLPWYDEQELNNRLRSAIRRGAGRVFETHDASGRSRAALVIIWDQHRAYYLLGGLDRTIPHRGALSFALRDAMWFVREEVGLSQFDLEGSNQPSIASAFEHYGAEALAYHYMFYKEGNVFDD